MTLHGVSFEDLWAKHRRDIEGMVRGILSWHWTADGADRLMAAGQEALWTASLSFEAGKSSNGDFWTYASHRVRGAILDELRRWDYLPRQGRAMVIDEETGAISWAMLYPCGLTPAKGVAITTTPETHAAESEMASKLEVGIEAVLRPDEQRVARMLVIEQKGLGETADAMRLTTGRICQIRKEVVYKLQVFFGVDG